MVVVRIEVHCVGDMITLCYSDVVAVAQKILTDGPKLESPYIGVARFGGWMLRQRLLFWCQWVPVG